MWGSSSTRISWLLTGVNAAAITSWIEEAVNHIIMSAHMMTIN